MTEKPLVSVIVPVYKVEQYIRQCVDSILTQTYRNLEIILVDDGSPDNCPQICDEYALTDRRVVVIHQRNGGVANARNSALNICTGDYVAFVDSDDWIESNMIQRMLSAVREHDVDAAFCRANIIDGQEITETRFAFFPNETVVTAERMVELSLKDEVSGQAWLRLMKRDCWENVRFPEGRNYEDLAISFQPFLYAEKGAVFLTEALYNYRMNQNGISLGGKSKNAYDIFQAFRDHYNYAKQNMKSVEKVCFGKTACHAIGYCNSYLHFRTVGEESCLHEVNLWLQENQLEIIRSRAIPFSRKLMIFGYLRCNYLYSWMYYVVYRMVNKAE